MLKINDVGHSIGKLAVVILTFNEEENISQALVSVQDWADEVFVLDSLSYDRTVEICSEFDCTVINNKFENFSKQRNFALTQLGISCEWVLFLDADEWMPPDLKDEISQVIKSSPIENGYYLNRKFIWMGTWVKRGYYPTWTLRLFRHDKGRCEDRAVNEHMIIDGCTARLNCDYIHEDLKPISEWAKKHINRARLEAIELFNKRDEIGYTEVDVTLFGSQEKRKRWLRYKVWNRLPPLIRPFFYFLFRYVIAGGFLDGKHAFTYNFLQAFWFPMLIDIFYLELIYRENIKIK